MSRAPPRYKKLAALEEHLATLLTRSIRNVSPPTSAEQSMMLSGRIRITVAQAL